MLTLVIDPLRVVWKIRRSIDPNAATMLDRPPVAGAFVDIQNSFVHLMEQWLRDSCPPVRRLAFGGKVMLDRETREEAYDLLGQFLRPYVTVDRNTYELQYRINRKRPHDNAGRWFDDKSTGHLVGHPDRHSTAHLDSRGVASGFTDSPYIQRLLCSVRH